MTGESLAELVLDTGPLCHLAKANWLGVLRSVATPRIVVIPDAVEHELFNGLHENPALQSVLDAAWIGRRILESDSEIQAFAYFSSLLVAGTSNIGEAAVLAYASQHDATAVIDDGPARHAAQQANVTFQGTLGLLCQAIRAGHLTVPMVSHVADHLMETAYRLPFGPGGFEQWARENDLLSNQ